MLEIIKSMIGYIEMTGGLYYAEKNDAGPAIKLKAAAAEAKGLEGRDAQLNSIEAYIAENFSKEA